jgi:hypothetical protein
MATLLERIFGTKPEEKTNDVPAAFAAEAYDPREENRGWISMGGNGFTPQINWLRSVERCERLVQQNGIFRRFIELITDFVHGNGFALDVAAQDDDLKDLEPCIAAIGRETFYGNVNRVDLKLRQQIFEQTMCGETCNPLTVNPQTGAVEIGFLPPKWINSVELSPMNITDPISITIQNGVWMFEDDKGALLKDGGHWKGSGIQKKLKVLRYDREPYLRDKDGNLITEIVVNEKGEPTERYKPNPHYGKLSGDVAYLRTGELIGQSRANGDGFAIIDWAIILDQIIHDVPKSRSIQRAFTIHLVLKGASQAEIDAAKNMALPTGLRPFVTNEKTELRMLNPSINIGEETELIRTLIRLTANAVGIPEYAVGDGTQTNVATAAEQAPVMWTKFMNRRKSWEAYLSTIFRYAVEQANDFGMLYRTIKKDGVESKGETVRLSPEQLSRITTNVVFLPFEKSGADQTATAFKSIVDAVLLASREGKYISNETARQIVANQLATVGIKIDPEDEKRQIEKERRLAGVTPSGAESDMQDIE